MEEEQPTKKPERGTFTQIPNVFFDTCNLPETAQMLFLRMVREFGHKGGVFTGSIRKLSTIIRLSKSTVDRGLKTLETARLATIERTSSSEETKAVMQITLNLADLWQLNKAYNAGYTVPIWDKVMPECSNVGQNSPNLGQRDINLGHAVPDVSTKSPPIRSNTINTNSNTEEENTSSSTDPYWSLWCQSRSPGKKVVITPLSAKNLLHCQNLAIICQEIEQELTVDLILAVEQWSRKEYGYKKYWPGNLVNDLPEYLKEQSTREPEEPALSDEELERIVLWTRWPHDIDDPIARCNLFEEMTLREARAYEWDYWTPMGEEGPLSRETIEAIVYARQMVAV